MFTPQVAKKSASDCVGNSVFLSNFSHRKDPDTADNQDQQSGLYSECDKCLFCVMHVPPPYNWLKLYFCTFLKFYTFLICTVFHLEKVRPQSDRHGLADSVNSSVSRCVFKTTRLAWGRHMSVRIKLFCEKIKATESQADS